MLNKYEAGHDPLTAINILKALCWGIQAWDIDMLTTTIKHCFRRALFKETAIPPEDLLITQILNDFQQLCTLSGIQNPMGIKKFLNPAEEVVEDFPEDIEQHIIEQLEPEKPENNKETIYMEEDPQITITEALDMVKRLCLYKEQQDKGNIELIQQLNYYKQRLGARRLKKQQQQDIWAFFVC